MYPHKKLDWHISRLEKQLQEHPEDPEARFELARATLSRGLYHGGGEATCNQALAQARKVLGEDPLHVGAMVVAGSALVGMGRPDAARKYLDEATRLDAERADLHLALGALYRSESDRHLALKHLETACRLAPESWEPHLYLGRVLAERAQEVGDSRRLIERAQFHLVRALQLEPSQDLLPTLLRDVGQTCLATGRYQEAEKLFIRLREHERHRASARLNLGMVAYHLGKYKNAIQHFRQYLEERPEDPRVHARVAMAFLQLGEPKRAREACNQALLIDPGNRSARYTLGCALLEEGNPSEAMRVFKEALEENPDHMEAYLELCRVRRVSKDNVWLTKALKAELTAYDKAPLESGLKTPRSVTRQRVEILLDQLRAAGPSMLPTLVEGLAVSQDEGLRFRIWESACELAAAALAEEVGLALREPGKTFGADLGRRALAAAAALPEPVLTRGLTLEEEDLKRAAVDRHGPTSDVNAHRKNVETQRREARAHQALVLLAVASRRSRSGRRLLERWAATADAELGVAALVGLGMTGDPASVKALHELAHRRGSSLKAQELVRALVPPPASRPPRPVTDREDARCTACGRTTKECTHLMAGSEANICDVCVVEIGRNRQKLLAPDEATCQFCGKSHLESRGVYRHQGVDICNHCLELSLGLVEREEVDKFLATW